MDLLGKVRSLVGALVHKPFTPRPEKAGPDEGPDPAERVEIADGRLVPAGDEAGAEDAGRVADLIAQQKQEGAD